MFEDRIDDRIRDSARDYHQPPETPRDAMWMAIRAERAERKAAGRGRPTHPLRWVAGIAALLALGIGLGRLSVDRPSPPTAAPSVTSAQSPRVSAAAYQLATTEHLGQSEAFLTLFRTSLGRAGDERLASATARQLLATNRLLLDSPAARNARTRLLLQDLELVLAEIAQLSPQPKSRDLDLITRGLEQGGVLSRLRTAVPSGASTPQGAL